MRGILAATVLAVTITACSLNPTEASPLTAGNSSALPAGSIGSNGPVIGVNLYALSNYTAAQTLADGVRTLSYIKDTLHARAVDLVWNMYVPGYRANSVVSRKTTMSAANIGILTRLAKRYRLAVEYRPLLFVLAAGDTWEGLIRPSDPARWFGSYFAQNRPYLKMAQKYHISEYVVGTEMNRVSSAPQWQTFLARSARIFKGEISYAAYDRRYFSLARLPQTRLAGMDMYEPLNLPASAPPGLVVAAYEKFFAGMPRALLARTAIQETGIQARVGAYADPGNLRHPGVRDEAIQYNWFIAACRTVKRFKMRAVFFWKVDLADFPLIHPARSLSTWEGKRGAVAISRCDSILRS